jgi:LPS-assembly protein
MRSPLQFVITAVIFCHLFQAPELVISQALPGRPADSGSQAQTETQTGGQNAPASGPANGKQQFSWDQGEPLTLFADHQEEQGNVASLEGNAEIHFRGYILRGDTISFDKSSNVATAEGHVSLDGGPHDVHLGATHGVYNVRERTGRFYDATGTTGTRFKGPNVTLTSTSPVSFTGRIVEKTGEQEYVIYHATLTSCELPHPKWTFSSAKAVIEIGDSAHIYHSVFWLKGVPVIYLPFAAPPVEKVGRQSGFLLPVITNSSTKGTVLGDSFYWAINRSMDADLGAEYLSRRGWLFREVFRAKPSTTSYVNFDYLGVEDRLNQGGQDIRLNAENRFANDWRGVASVEYLSSYIFRLAFAETFTLAVNSEVNSVGFLSKTYQATSVNAFASRYQNFESTLLGDSISIVHAPGFEVSRVDQRVGESPLFWSYDVDSEGLSRTEPNFNTPNLASRFDLEPNISLPLFLNGWTVRPEIGLRNTFYTESQTPGPIVSTPIQRTLDRRSVETAVELRPPTLGRVFDRPVAGRKVKHTLEPYWIYRYNNGVNNFGSVIRFDERDILSNTNEFEYGLTQRLYLKHIREQCNQEKPLEAPKAGIDAAEAEKLHAGSCTPAGANEFLSWVVKQKYFLDPNFGGAVVDGIRNVLTSTVDFAGIAFLTNARNFAPVVSQLRMRTTANTDVQWELDYDTKQQRVNASTFFTTFHLGDYFFGGSHAYFLVPGDLTVTQQIPGAPPPLPGPSEFNQLRLLAGYGSPSKRGLSVAANVGFDSHVSFLQYAATQASYNWDCCGISLEYRRFALGQVRNENAYRFSFTLANIGTFGNLRRQERLF